LNGAAGAAGGAGGSITLSAPGTLTLGGTTSVAGGTGGGGGSGYYNYSTSAYSGTGGNGGAGGKAGTMSASGASLVLSGATLNANGGGGGSGGSYGTAAGSAGANGGGSPITLSTAGDITVTGSDYVYASQLNLLAGKSISFGTTGSNSASGYLYSNYGSPITLIANWNGSSSAPDVATAAQCGTVFCGIGGTGSIDTNYYTYYYGQLQAPDGGAISLKAAGPVDLTSISVRSNGGSGGYSGDYYYAGTQQATRGGAVTISSTQGDVKISDVSAMGGYGGHGASGTTTSPNGGTGGTGGAGGSIRVSAAGSLSVSGYVDASGGAGGSGGDGYYDYSLSTPAYTGTGGAGGAGGNAGSITLGGASITLDNANIRVLGGYPGLGSTYGTTTGALGAAGASSALQLGTAGDIAVLGYNNLAASRVALLAGKAITLGNGTSDSSGHINSTGSDTLLVANWNGSTSTPDVATTAQCGTAFCGISGSGGISNGYDYYEGYYYTGQLQNQNGGAITLKAAGPVDLKSISVSSIGGNGDSYYYVGVQEAGSGGAVTISSTQGDVTLGDVSIRGGYGRYGASGTAAAPNGGAAGAGGTGGSIHASAAGALNVTGSIDVSGGNGGWGGDGYYDYSLATPAYTGTGGAGGVGGNGGTMSLSGASVVVSGVALTARSGPGGPGGLGTTAGTAGGGGTGGNINLNATGGNVTLNSGSSLIGFAAGDALVLASAGNFINNAGASALAAPNGRWLVYSTNPTSDVRGGIAYDFKQYGISYNGTAYAGPGAGNGVIYSVAPSVISVLTGTVTKTYDGTTAAPLSPGNFSTTGAIDGDIVVVNYPSSGVYADKNVGTAKGVSATVAITGATNGTTPVYGYRLASATASGNIGQIDQRALSTWVGSSSGLWSNPANWDAIPDGANVLEVSIPAVPAGGSYQVTYDAGVGTTSLKTLTSAQTLGLSGGSLTINGSLSTAGYVQSGGTLGGTGGLSVTNSFSQSGGTIGLTGSASAAITQATGDLIIRNLTAPNVSLTAQSGGLSQTGPIVASALVTKSVAGTNLSDSGNQVGSFTATNIGSGNVTLTNKGALSVASIANSGGNITLNNTGAVTALGALSASGDVNVTSDSLALSSGSSIGAGRDAIISATVGDLAATNAKVSATRDIKAQVAGDLRLNDGSSFTAGNDIWLTLNGVNSTLYLNDLSGLKPSYLWAEAPSTIHLEYTARTSGGFVVDGVPADVVSYSSVADGSGLFHGPTKAPAALDAGLDVVGIALPPPVITTAATEAVANTVVATTITSTTTAATTATASTATTTKVEAPPPTAAVTTAGGSGTSLLSTSNQTIGGTEGTFGGSSTTPAASSAPASSTAAPASSSGAAASSDKSGADKPAEDKPAVAKKEEKKEEEKKDDKKKDEAAARKDDKPAAKKVATCS